MVEKEVDEFTDLQTREMDAQAVAGSEAKGEAALQVAIRIESRWMIEDFRIPSRTENRQ